MGAFVYIELNGQPDQNLVASDGCEVIVFDRSNFEDLMSEGRFDLNPDGIRLRALYDARTYVYAAIGAIEPFNNAGSRVANRIMDSLYQDAADIDEVVAEIYASWDDAKITLTSD